MQYKYYYPITFSSGEILPQNLHDHVSDRTGNPHNVTLSNESFQSWIFTENRDRGTNGGTFASGVWTVRDLNRTQSDGGSESTLSQDDKGNGMVQFTQGTYIITGNASANSVGQHRLRLVDLYTGEVIAKGISVGAPLMMGNTVAGIETTFKVIQGGVRNISVQHYASESRIGDGMGQGMGDGEEVYCTLNIRRI